MNKYKYFLLVQEFIDDSSFDDLDIELQENFNMSLHNDDSLYDDYDIICNKNGRADGHPIRIDKLISTLQHFKSIGANYVELDYNCDHIGYDLSAYNIRVANKDEEVEYHKNKNIEYAKQQKINDLQQQINSIRNEK